MEYVNMAVVQSCNTTLNYNIQLTKLTAKVSEKIKKFCIYPAKRLHNTCKRRRIYSTLIILYENVKI